MLLFCLMTIASVHASVVVSDGDGYFLDDYGNNLGVSSASSVRFTGGAVSLISPNTTGDYRTVEIVPTSFDQWRQLDVTAGSLFAPGDLLAEVRSEDGLTVLIPPQPVTGPISLASLNSPTLVPGIRVHVYFTKSGAVAPTVDSLLVTWHPMSQVSIDKQGPAEVQAARVWCIARATR
ncbi:MAG TPA: hypothetical protein VK530_01135 [Candidatus Acidoferrum sp.]|nr:hypothetical protein [Candidatus Acidoferrum sp.]